MPKVLIIATILVLGIVFVKSIFTPAFALTITSSGQTSITARVLGPSGGGGGGGGGGGSSNPPITGSTIVFSGNAYPKSYVTILQDAKVVATTIAGQDSKFSFAISSVSAGTYIYSVYSEDKYGVKSPTLTFPVSVSKDTLMSVSGIFLAPTISADKSKVKRGETLVIFGQTIPQAEVTIVINSAEEHYAKIPADKNGVYLLNYDTTPLEPGDHIARSKSGFEELISPFSKAVNFSVGLENVPFVGKSCPIKGDLNGDCKVNLSDFSIAAYWFSRTLDTNVFLVEKENLNGDAKLNLVDFSIMAYYWTG